MSDTKDDKSNALNIVSEHEVFEGDYIRILKVFNHAPVFDNGVPIAGRVVSIDKYSMSIMLVDETIFNLPLPVRLDYEIDLAFQSERKLKFSKESLLSILSCAKEYDAKFICVAVHVEGTLGSEYIIDSKDNFDSKIQYYQESYDEDLYLKSSSKKIQITGAAYGDSFSELEDKMSAMGGKRYD